MHRSPIHQTRTSAAKLAAHATALCAALAICTASVSTAPRTQAGGAMARISFGSDLSSTPLDGRIYVVFSVNQNNPRMGVVEEEVESAQVFGADIDGLAPGQIATIPLDAIGYPARTLADIPPGDYWVQGRSEQIHHVPPLRRPYREAPDGRRRRPALEFQARKFLQHARAHAH